MRTKTVILLIALLTSFGYARAQKRFIEGTINYKVRLESADKKSYTGTYIFTFKGGQIRKELQLNNGYLDVLLINTLNNTAYTLQVNNGKKYAIQLNMDDVMAKQKKYAGYKVKEDKSGGKTIAGLAVYKGDVLYTDGSRSEIYYTSEMCPDKSISYERFPDAQFLPLYYSFKDEKGITMYMEAEKVSLSPVENSLFRIPADYKIISNEEYKQIRK